jgi:hypothetical protein
VVAGVLHAVSQHTYPFAQNVVDLQSDLCAPWEGIVDRGRGVEGVGIILRKSEIMEPA